MTEKGLLELICICEGFYDLPVFSWYLGTCCDRKGITWVKIAKSCFEILCRTCV